MSGYATTSGECMCSSGLFLGSTAGAVLGNHDGLSLFGLHFEGNYP